MFSTDAKTGRGVRVAGAALVIAAVATTMGNAQTPGLPVLQNAFSNPGIAVAGNFANGTGQSFYGVAAGYGLGSGRLQLSGAAGVQRANGATRGAYGGRVAAMLWSSSGGALGAGAFGGLGGATRTRDASGTTNAAVMILPLGVSVGYRRALGASRGISGYVSPLYRWTRAQTDIATTTTGTIGGAAGVDFAISQSFGATIGAEFGKSGAGPVKSSSTVGFALSFVPGR